MSFFYQKVKDICLRFYVKGLSYSSYSLESKIKIHYCQFLAMTVCYKTFIYKLVGTMVPYF